jgi:toxin ParE1/3/4
MDFKLTPSALYDFRNIGDYTIKNWDKIQCDKYLDKLDNRFYWLAENPKSGSRRDEIKQGYYSYPEGSHIIYYRIQSNFIEIIAILHEQMDAKRHI